MGRPKTKHISPVKTGETETKWGAAETNSKVQTLCNNVWSNQSPDLAYTERVRRCKVAASAQGFTEKEIEGVEFAPSWYRPAHGKF